jgi:hypothetical protein
LSIETADLIFDPELNAGAGIPEGNGHAVWMAINA